MVSAAQVLWNSQLLLLDFDGPVCGLFRGVDLDAEVRSIEAAVFGSEDRSSERHTDPLASLRQAAEIGGPALHQAEEAVRQLEVRAAGSAPITYGVGGLLGAWSAAGRAVVIVTNNCEDAVRATLERALPKWHELPVCARPALRPELMKPNPYLLGQAIELAGLAECHAVLLGDSPSDIEAARAQGVASIGFVNKPHKRTPLREAGATALVEELSLLGRPTLP